jgi:hypothetical protein
VVVGGTVVVVVATSVVAAALVDGPSATVTGALVEGAIVDPLPGSTVTGSTSGSGEPRRSSAALAVVSSGAGVVGGEPSPASLVWVHPAAATATTSANIPR